MNEVELMRILLGNDVTAPYFCGVISHDQLNTQPVPDEGYYICNSDDSNGPGKHWLAVCWSSQKKQPAELFDSLAHLPKEYDKNFTDFLISNGPDYSFSLKRVQSESSIKCGEFCVFFVYHRCKGFTFEEILAMFCDTNLEQNDVIVEQFMQTM